MTRYCLQIVGYAFGPSPYDGQYVKQYDPSHVNLKGYDGGILETTPRRSEALLFPTVSAALEKWKEQAPPPYHLRIDGKPNRPLSAFTVEIEPVHFDG